MEKYPDKETLIKFLGNVSLFNNATNSILTDLAEKTILTSYPSDKMVIQKGDVGHTMYIIFSGHLKVHDGEHKVAELKEGQFFGELSLLDSEPRSMSVTTLMPSVLGSISGDAFYQVLKKFPEMTKDIIAALNRRLRNQNDVLISEFRTRESQLTELVNIRTNELAQKNTQLEHAMEDLKKSQQQLIQSEKLASLGQLIAGIAHEIQNPLNFVNNFSQLSGELIEEMKDIENEEEKNEVLSDLKQNMEKIHHHGKRADSIVKNMLEHSRTGTGEKQLTNINQLSNEYLNLAFHSVSTKNAHFSCELIKEFDENIPEIKIVSQEISRVFLNLFNNAFYAVNERASKKIENYKPKVSLRTLLKDDQITISISDNGNGIPQHIREKIFEPFFTTKPTGEGTGLGLSLSYDIIKTHGGEINFTSIEGEGTEFIVSLPLPN